MSVNLVHEGVAVFRDMKVKGNWNLRRLRRGAPPLDQAHLSQRQERIIRLRYLRTEEL